jgi:hypothetical protein
MTTERFRSEEFSRKFPQESLVAMMKERFFPAVTLFLDLSMP